MSLNSTARNAVLIVAGVIAGGIIAYVSDGIVPPAVVMAFLFVVLLVENSRELRT